ncbi:MAG: transporter substrate-binding domain-containing protein [Rhodospirillales bacterium]
MIARLGAWLAVACLLLSAPAAAQGVLERAAARGTLVAAAMPDTLPQAARDAEGRLIGFDIEVAEEIARRLGLEIAFVTPGWQEILAGGWARRWDLAVVSMTPTAERAATLDFPVVYRHDVAVLAVHKDNLEILAPEDASGKVVGVKKDTTQEAYLEGTLGVFMGREQPTFRIRNPVIRRYTGKDEALLALAKGDGVELEAAAVTFAAARQAVVDRLPVRVLPGSLFTEPVAVAVDKGDPRFARAVEDAVLRMSGDGTLAALSVKWFGTDLSQAVGP